MQSSPLPSSPPFMSGVCSSTFQSTLPSRQPICKRSGAFALLLSSFASRPMASASGKVLSVALIAAYPYYGI
ncbi:hypothetical protein [Treponema endosymbiont of Eucomonympha sp.]|uniref:hypothetical protein n=1 Tax=Treponema endosymbiont of Eucomonympha sp. TaxID=1580831 RepID=UPI001396803E|nr:hypothetical protein [Treponema endosymbiont of Eucomonympha sp.]